MLATAYCCMFEYRLEKAQRAELKASKLFCLGTAVKVTYFYKCYTCICKSYFIVPATVPASRQLLCFMEMLERWRGTGTAFALIVEGVCCLWLASRCVHTCFVYFAKSRLQLILMHVEEDEKLCGAEMYQSLFMRVFFYPFLSEWIN